MAFFLKTFIKFRGCPNFVKKFLGPTFTFVKPFSSLFAIREHFVTGLVSKKNRENNLMGEGRYRALAWRRETRKQFPPYAYAQNGVLNWWQ